MTEKEKWDKVINGLDELRNYADNTIHPIVSPENWNVYDEICDMIDNLKADTLALLKEQEPQVRVMTLEEVTNAIKRKYELFTECEKERRWVRCGIAHFCSASDEDCKIGFLMSQDGEFYTQWWRICYKNYNKTWRCWTSEPTNEQRKAVKWE